MPTPALRHRLRNYATLTPSFILFVVFAAGLTEKFNMNLLLLTLFWAAGCVGPALELFGKPVGRPVTLWVVGTQAAVIIGIFVFIAISSGDARFQSTDIPGLLFLFLPIFLFVWNLRAGRPAATPATTG